MSVNERFGQRLENPTAPKGSRDGLVTEILLQIWKLLGLIEVHWKSILLGFLV
jgi:hypothetical protein